MTNVRTISKKDFGTKNKISRCNNNFEKSSHLGHRYIKKNKIIDF